MIEDFERKRQRQTARTQSVLHFAMGALILGIGVLFLLAETLGIKIFGKEPSVLDKIMGGMFVLYGIWRIYRGYKLNRFYNE
jgi:hypothetical protein